MATVVGSSYSASPSSTTLGGLRDEVARYVKMPNAAQGLQIAELHIKSAIRKINTRQWEWLLASQDLTTSASATYTLDNEFNKPRNLHALDSSGNKVLRILYLDPKTFDVEIEIGDASGTPNFYTVRNARSDGLLTLERVPSSNFITTYPTLRLQYYQYLQYPSGAGSTIDVPNDVELFILWYAKALMASDFMPQKYALARSESEDVWRAMVRNNFTLTDWD